MDESAISWKHGPDALLAALSFPQIGNLPEDLRYVSIAAGKTQSAASP